MRPYIVLVTMLAGVCLADDSTNTIVTAKLTAHRMMEAGCMEPGGGFYTYQTEYVVTSPTNFAGITLTTLSFGSGPNESRSNIVATVHIPTAALQSSKTDKKPCFIKPQQIKNETESNKSVDPVSELGRDARGSRKGSP